MCSLCRPLPLLIGPALLLAALGAWAQQPPTAGTQLQQIPQAPRLPEPSSTTDSQAVEAPVQPPINANTQAVMVRTLTLDGNRVFGSADLVRISGFNPDTLYTLEELRQLAAKVTAHYHRHGYFLAQTVIPAQDITEGVVRFTVLEGRIGAIRLNNQSGVADQVATALLQGLQGAEATTKAALERSLLLLNDLPGTRAHSILRPGTAPGTADLQLNLTTGSGTSGSVEADNQGNHYTGTYRLGTALYVNELLGWGDVASVRILTSGEGLTYGRASYQALAGSTTVGLAASSLYYRLGGAFANLQSTGTAMTSTLYASYPLVRARRQNLSAHWAMDSKDFDDRTGAGTPSQNRKRVQNHTAGLKGNRQDERNSSSVQYALSWTHGTIDLQEATTRSNDAITAQSNGDFDKLAYSLSWLQESPAKRSLHINLSGQFASKNLDASEKFSLGGSGGVRAYPAGEASGDEGVILTLEGRTPWPAMSQYLAGAAQAVAFVDMGSEMPNKNAWGTGSSTRRSLYGMGFGLNFTSPSKWTASAYCAFKLGDETATSAPDATWRLWLQAAKYF